MLRCQDLSPRRRQITENNTDTSSSKASAAGPPLHTSKKQPREGKLERQATWKYQF